MKCVLFQQPRAMHVLNKKGSDKGLLRAALADLSGSTFMLTHRDSEPSAKTSTTKARENITLKSYSSNAEGGWTDYLLSDIFKDMT